LVIFLAVNIFGAGIAVGRGDISLGSGQPTEINRALPENLDYASVDKVYDILRTSFDGEINEQKLIEGLKHGLVAAADDPYTEYFDPEEAKQFQEALSGSFTGIGAELGNNDKRQIIVVSPIAGFPAEKAGLESKDIIAGINGETTDGLSIEGAVRKIRGDAGTDVSLTIVRGEEPPFDVKITRQKISLPSVDYKVEAGIGYMKINQFNNDTKSQAQKAAQEFSSQNVKGVILDLRGNPGGYLTAAVEVSGIWLPDGSPVVSERRSGEVVSQESASGSAQLKGIPTIVLINGGSASASEIVAGALRDNGAAVLLGEQTFGKGSVQKIEQLSDGGALKVTIARWYTPKGSNIDKEGIAPDIEVKLSSDQATSGRDIQKERAVEEINNKINR
jgi:carboxyl-terminal processing protease